MQQPQIADLLIAPPQIMDPRFQESVIFLAAHDDLGAWGLVLNRPTGTTTRDLFARLGWHSDVDVPLYWGGPVSQGVVWMLHDPSWHMDNTIAVNAQWSMTSHAHMFDALAQDQPRHWRLFTGFSAWTPGQLEGEAGGSAPWTHHSTWLWCRDLGPEWCLAQRSADLWNNSIAVCGNDAVNTWLA